MSAPQVDLERKFDRAREAIDEMWDEIVSLRQELEAAENKLREIGDYAHEHSTGPAEVDALWTVREMAYELI